ncbi:hypothetical protein SADUNF_Sadunf06G0128800 [Salix dunnii]|uniref:Uncharacterized protein n=1 Tax=Salix dunnii TaxID=1413687 RepID=A0A835MXG2_9ROSI|nr:hypothetical protein SADUNF_Sadunf06G0128800 [Salix dunnii]
MALRCHRYSSQDKRLCLTSCTEAKPTGGAETGEEVNLIEHQQLRKAVKREEAPMPASHSASESMSNCTWSHSTRVRSTGTQALCRVHPAPPGRHKANKDTFTFESYQNGYVT